MIISCKWAKLGACSIKFDPFNNYDIAIEIQALHENIDELKPKKLIKFFNSTYANFHNCMCSSYAKNKVLIHNCTLTVLKKSV